MEINEIFKYIAAAWQEVYLIKFKAALLVTLISFSILAIGIYKPSVFRSETTIFADTQNIIKPLLGKQTSITSVKQSKTAQVRDVIFSPRQLNKVIDAVYGKNAFPTPQLLANKWASLRESIDVEGLSGNYLKISYQDATPDITFRLLNEVVSLFVEDSANTKRNESRSAYNFIEQQVVSYKDQLLLAEKKLKIFKSSHLDGTESEVESRISQLRNEIEDMKIFQMESLTRISSLKNQLRSQDKFSSNDYEAAIYHSRLKELRQYLDNLLLSYKDDYPEVVEARYQIGDMEKNITDLSFKEKDKSQIGAEFNPLYQELSSKLSTAQVSQNTRGNRLNAFKVLLEEAYERRKRVANNQAELSELNRDYSVIKGLYEDMLANKEKARLSMVLDIEGQGVNYKVQEPASYPTLPLGPRFLHFFIAGPFLGFLVLVSLFLVKILLDNKIRFASQLAQFTSVPLLISIDHKLNSSERNKKRLENITFIFGFLFVASVYVGIAISHRYDYPIYELFTPLYSLLMEQIR
jgi:polysaccharide chain length determinant protein (PEP-CTERM system associated)